MCEFESEVKRSKWCVAGQWFWRVWQWTRHAINCAVADMAALCGANCSLQLATQHARALCALIHFGHGKCANIGFGKANRWAAMQKRKKCHTQKAREKKVIFLVSLFVFFPPPTSTKQVVCVCVCGLFISASLFARSNHSPSS